MLLVNRPVTRHHNKGAEIAAGALGQRGISRKAADPAIAIKFTDQAWTALLRSGTDHADQTAETREILRAAQSDARFLDDSRVREPNQPNRRSSGRAREVASQASRKSPGGLV